MGKSLLYQVGDLVGVEGFGYVVIGAVFQRHDGGLDGGVAGHDDDDELGVDLVHAALEFDAIGAVHFDIDQSCIPALFGELSQRVGGVFEGGDVVAFFAEPFAE